MFRNAHLTKVDLETLFDLSPNPYLIIDRELVIVGMNIAYLTVTMRDRAELSGRKLFEAFPSEAGSVSDRMLRSSLNRVLETGQVDHLPLIPYPIALPDGRIEERYWSATHTPLLDETGQVQLILQHTVDVTEVQRLRQRAENDMKVEVDILRRAHEVSGLNLLLDRERGYFRSLLEQAPSFTAVLRGPDHVFDLTNAAYRSLVKRENLTGKRVADALPEVALQGFIEVLDRVYQTGEPFQARAMKVMLEGDPDGTVRELYLDFVFQPILTETGEPFGIFVQGHDVTEQKLAEDAARENEERFRSLAQTVPNHAWSMTPNGEIEWCNDRFYEYSGLDPETVIGRTPGQSVHPEDMERLASAWAGGQRTGQLIETELRFRRHDGIYHWHLTRAIPFFDDEGRLVRWVGTNTDIEVQKRTEEQLEYLAEMLEHRIEERTQELEQTQEVLRQSQKMEAIGNLAGGIAHDFNNLLQVVAGNLQLLARHVAGNVKANQQLENALTATMRGARLASQLLSFSRRQPLAPKVINLGRLVRDMDHMVRRSLGEAIEIETIVGGGLWNTLVDPTNVETAVLNLAINARDAMEGRGKLTIEIGNAYLDDDYVRSTPDVGPGQYVMLAVTDTGPGIPADIIEKVFDPFFTTKPEGKGTGLGLSMVYGFVKQSGGHVRIYSEVGSGTTVKLYLPRSLEQEDVVQNTPLAIVGGSETVLVVEDDEAVRETAVSLLMDLGYTVLKARDAAAGLVVLDSGVAIDLLFTDVVMPGPLKSTELARRAKERLPAIGVLFTSGYTENSIVHDGKLDAGIQFLSKPYTRDQLARKVRQIIDAEKAALQTILPSPPPPVVPLVQKRQLCVLLCEDDFLIRLSTTEILEEAGMQVLEAGSIAESLAAVETASPDILVTDLHLPDGSGSDLARVLREKRSDLPVIFATGDSRSSAAGEIEGAEIMAKPYSHAALEAMIRKLCAGPS
ncbi:hybrid sensor histidine kinase/response regulator [Rhizobium paknamense]|uniref:histidine kinase n=1 Tax=Rhizobium paknamense TaxID=1206817 RepID=A0ABU0IBJ2_9HYPH|nr:PAS domain-containing protein [Rhizobium paknamense]MDQ0455592.1 PAS domain S-box-containing protein [Rhizobium paknamense]